MSSAVPLSGGGTAACSVCGLKWGADDQNGSGACCRRAA